jgi:hypothetical protein
MFGAFLFEELRKTFKMDSQKNWILCCFLNFLVASVMGLLMRFSYLFPLEINYIYLLHAHSHVAMLGWTYLMIYVLIVVFYIPRDKRKKPIYNQLFWSTEITVIGMMVSFPIQGYALFSILFSTAHILLSYVFCRLVWKDILPAKTGGQKLILTALLFMLFSTFGVWCLGPAISTLGKQSVFYQIAIQFFLYFQFNGWFLIAVLALFLKQFEEKINANHFKIFLISLIVSTLLTVSFPISWYIDSKEMKWINAIGVLLQLFAFVYFYKMLKPQIKTFTAGLGSIARIVYGLALSSLLLKLSLQLFVIYPDLANTSHQIRNFVIGFIHLTSLGIITGFLFGILIQNKMLSGQCNLMRSGIKCFAFGYISTEILLFFQGILFYCNRGKLWGYFEIIFAASTVIVSGLIFMVISILNKKQELIN